MRPSCGSKIITGFENLVFSQDPAKVTPGLSRLQAFVQPIACGDLELPSGPPRNVLCLDLCGETSSSCEQRQPCDIALVIDTSGSMHGVMDKVQATCRRVFEELGDEDRISVVKFESHAKVLLPLTTKASVSGFERICSMLVASGGTNLDAGLQKGIETLQPRRARSASDNFSTALLVLSDGCPTAGECRTDVLCTNAVASLQRCARAVTLHSLGFTPYHAIELMNQLPQLSTGQAGSYYYVGCDADINAAVGDCLGLLAAECVCQSMTVACKAGLAEGADGTDLPCQWFGRAKETSQDICPMLCAQPMEELEQFSLQSGEHQTLLLIVPAQAAEAHVQLQWDSGKAGKQSLDLVVEAKAVESLALQEPEGLAELPLDQLAVVSHLLRLKVAAALATLASAGRAASPEAVG